MLTITSAVGFALTWQGEVNGSAVTFTKEIPDSATAFQQVAYLSGAVNQPGIYEIDNNTSLGNLIERAGGFTKEADAEFVTLELNLAKLVENREHVYIPSVSERTAVAGVSSANPPANPMGGKVNINTADQAALESLPGIGPSLATSIIAARPFSAITDLQNVKGIGDAKYKQIESLVTL